MRRIIKYILTLLVLSLLVAGCGDNKTPDQASDVASENTPEVEDTNSVQESVPQTSDSSVDNTENSEDTQASTDTSEEDSVTIEIDAFNFGYSLEEIRVKEGQTVKIVMTNSGGNHDFVIDALDVQTPIIGTGDTTTVEFVASEKGSFEYYCSVGSHRAAGMLGTLIIE